MASAALVVPRSRCCNRHELLNPLTCHGLVECRNIALIKSVERLFRGFELAVEQVENLDLGLRGAEVCISRDIGAAGSHLSLQPDKFQIKLQRPAERLEITFGDGAL